MRISGAVSKLFTLVSLCALGACADGPTQPATMAAPSTVRLAKDGATANAKLCKKDGYLTLLTETGAPFATEKECKTYGAAGGNYTSAPTFVANLTINPGGLSFSVRVDGTGLQPGSDLTVYISTSLGLLTAQSVGGVQPDGTGFLVYGTSCGIGATNAYGVGTTLGGATIESNHINTIC